jgi:hypothetical protein
MAIKRIAFLGLITMIGKLSFFVGHLDRYGERNKYEYVIWEICYNLRLYFIYLSLILFFGKKFTNLLFKGEVDEND